MKEEFQILQCFETGFEYEGCCVCIFRWVDMLHLELKICILYYCHSCHGECLSMVNIIVVESPGPAFKVNISHQTVGLNVGAVSILKIHLH